MLVHARFSPLCIDRIHHHWLYLFPLDHHDLLGSLLLRLSALQVIMLLASVNAPLLLDPNHILGTLNGAKTSLFTFQPTAIFD